MSPTDVLVQQDVPAEMRDGATLMANVYRPVEGGPYPVLLTRTPYGKDQPFNATYFDPVKAARNGYIVVVQDVRGRYASEGGKFTPFVKEYEDGYDSVEWAAKLSDSDGRVGMFGLSYFGKTQWHAAVMQPPALAGMVPGTTWGNHLNGVNMRGGVQEVGLNQSWSQTGLALNVLFRKYRDDPEQLGQKLPSLVGSIDTLLAGGGYDVLPLTDLPDPNDLVPFARGGFARSVDDPAWEYLNIDGKYDHVQASTFHIGGWYDCFIGETLRQYEAMREQAEQRSLRSPRLLVGPWTHGMFGSTVGELDFGVGSTGLFLDYSGNLTNRHLQWFDETLKGESTLEQTSPVEIFVMGENRWRGYDEWPVPSAREEQWYLREGGGLSRENPSQSPPDEYDYDPEDPVPTLGGAVLLPPILGSGPRDQRSIEERPDVLTYTSEVLQESYTALGPVHATLYAASSAPDTDFVVRLVDVYPDGRAILVTDGIIRASARESYPAPGIIEPVEPSLIEPSEVYEYTIDLWATGLSFLAGHRIRVEVTSSSFPRWDRNLNTGQNSAQSTETQVAHQRVFHDPERPSHVTLTVVDD